MLLCWTNFASLSDSVDEPFHPNDHIYLLSVRQPGRTFKRALELTNHGQPSGAVLVQARVQARRPRTRLGGSSGTAAVVPSSGRRPHQPILQGQRPARSCQQQPELPALSRCVQGRAIGCRRVLLLTGLFLAFATSSSASPGPDRPSRSLALVPHPSPVASLGTLSQSTTADCYPRGSNSSAHRDDLRRPEPHLVVRVHAQRPDRQGRRSGLCRLSRHRGRERWSRNAGSRAQGWKEVGCVQPDANGGGVVALDRRPRTAGSMA